ncbi:MAG: hypothetical protein HY050_06765 [Actinobacteria bacterium]|nr:hypothetical protein [Actinomycetota bacterium]
MSDITGQFAVAVVTQDEARIYGPDLERGTEHETIKARNPFTRHHHIRMAQFHHMRDVDRYMNDYLKSIAEALKPAEEVLLITHGNGKGSAYPALMNYFEKKYPDLAKKVSDNLDVDITRLTEPELLALAREWWDKKYGYHGMAT